MQSINLTKGPIAKNLLGFAVPILLSNLFQQLYNSVDSAVLGSFAGDTALAAVGSTAAVINVLIGFFLGIATGAGILYAMHYGAEDWKGLKSLIDTSIVMAVVAGAAISLVGLFFTRPILIMINTPEDVLEPGVQYLRIYLAGSIITLVDNVGAGLLRAEGDSRRPLLYLVCGGVTNLILDILFVAVFHWGVIGAAIATVIAQLLSATLSVIRLTKLDKRYCLQPLHIRPNLILFKDLVKISVPCGLQSSMYNIANLIVQLKINTFGSVAMAGVAAYSKIDGFIYMPMAAISMATSTFVAQNRGAGEYSRIQKGIRVSLFSSLICSLVMATAVFFSCSKLLGLFTSDPEAQTYGITMMHFMACTIWVFCPSDIFGSSIRGAGQATPVTIISAVCICVYRIIWLYAVLSFYNDIRIVFACYPISWFLSSTVMTVYYFRKSALRKAILNFSSELEIK